MISMTCHFTEGTLRLKVIFEGTRGFQFVMLEWRLPSLRPAGIQTNILQYTYGPCISNIGTSLRVFFKLNIGHAPIHHRMCCKMIKREVNMMKLSKNLRRLKRKTRRHVNL